jgi:hypothetical protein
METTLTLSLLYSLVTTVVAGVFAAMVLRRWWTKRRDGKPAPHLAAWGIGLALYFIGALAQVVLHFVWSPLFFALWYWSGALAVVPFLGLGTVYLLVRKGNIARNLNMAVVLMCAMTLPWTLFLTPLNGAAWHPGADMMTLYKTEVNASGEIVQQGILPASSRGTVRAFSPVMNGIGTLMLVGGAIYSARLFRRKQILPNRMWGNLIIAAGGLFPAVGGALDDLNYAHFKYFGIMVGIVVIFVGYLKTMDAPDEAEQPKRQAAGAQAGD